MLRAKNVLRKLISLFTVILHMRKIDGITRVGAIVVTIILIVAVVGGVLYWYMSVGPAAPRKVKIAVVSDIGGRGDLSFNDMAFKGGDEAEKDFGVEMVELVSKVEADYVPNL